MSQESMKNLNTQVLVGFTENRGSAWHYREGLQGEEPNHYAGAIPVDDVKRRLFHWEPAEGTVETTYEVPLPKPMFGKSTKKITLAAPDRKSIVRPAGTFGEDDPGAILGLFKQGFTVHGYSQWLLDNVEVLLGNGLAIGTAGLIKGGKVAWVQVEMAETLSTPQGVEYRPHLTAATSLDGSLATTYATGATVIICDNQLSAALRETSGLVAKVYHSRYSALKLEEVRQSLDIVEAVSKSMDAQIQALCETEVTDREWDAFLEATFFPNGRPEKGRGLTLNENRKQAVDEMYRVDDRVAPWNGTAFGVLQAMNTYQHHEASIQGDDRVGRNAEKMLSGEWDKFDGQVLKTLDKVLS